MKNVVVFCVILVSCSAKRNIQFSNSNSLEQIFISNQNAGLPGKCYARMKFQNELYWTEVLCESEVTKNIITQIHTDLKRLNYHLDQNEISKMTIGASTKTAVNDFQIRNEMANGGLDWATINRLKIK